MFATFKCDNCGKKSTVEFSGPTIYPEKCIKCNSVFSNSHRIPDFGEKVFNFNRALTNLTFHGLSNSNPDIVFESDLDYLETLYTHSSVDVKKLLTRILDLNYLMILRDAQDENIESLERYISKLELVHNNKINDENNMFIDLLDTTED